MLKKFVFLKKFLLVITIIYVAFMVSGCYKDYEFVEIYRAPFTNELNYSQRITNNEIPGKKDWVGFNDVLIKNGVARVTEANCPTKSCTHYVARPNNLLESSIICEPNGLRIIVEGDDVVIYQLQKTRGGE